MAVTVYAPDPDSELPTLQADVQPMIDSLRPTKQLTKAGREAFAETAGSGVVEMRGLEPLTPAMRTQCSPS